jgi:phosphoribosylformimino-5-aminoimidazole carboxamide ribotide isomerase
MIVIAAIDLLGGACVRLEQGSYATARRYAGDPAEVALGFARAGARWVHVVDLDAARGEPSANRGAIRRICEALARAGGAVPRLEVGGGIRSEQDAAELAEAGADRLILGTVLVREPERVAAMAARRSAADAGPELWAGIDARDGRVKVAGWEEEGGLSDLELARRARDLGLAGVVYTSIARDGTLAGPDVERTNRVAEACGLPVILSGGIGSEADVERVARERVPGVEGLIIGKALYEGRVDLAELIRRYD